MSTRRPGTGPREAHCTDYPDQSEYETKIKLIPAPDHRSPEQCEADKAADPSMREALARLSEWADTVLSRTIRDGVQLGAAQGRRRGEPLLWEGDQA